MTDPITHYQGRAIADMSPDELRAALVACIRYAQLQAHTHKELSINLRNVLDMDDHRQEQLFRMIVGLT